MSLLRRVKGHVSVEPVMFVYFMTMVFSNCLSTNLLLYKACDPTGAISERMGSGCANETEAQHVVAPINGWKALVQQLVPTVLTLFAGTWSDRHGRRRRPLILLPIFGQVAADAASAYCALRWSVSPVATAAVQALFVAFTGGAPMLFNGVNSYVADTTPDEWRTVKYGVLGATIAVGGILGMLVYGCVVVNVGFVAAYLVSVCLGLTAGALAFAFVDDSAAAADSRSATDRSPTPVSVAGSYDDKMPLYADVARTVNPMDVFRNCHRVLTRRRPDHGTTVLCLVLLACAPLTCVPLEGEMLVMYLFLRYKFKWNEIDFSIFNAYQMTIILGGTFIALGVLSHKFRMNDALIGMIASVFDLLAAVAFLLVSQPWQLYLVPPLELFRGAALALTSSIASKCVGSDELGVMNAIKLLIESVMKVGFLPFYNFVYNHTFETMPSAFFLISIILTAPLIVVFYLIYYLNKKSSNSLDNCCVNDEHTKQKTEISPITNSDLMSYYI